MKNEIRVERAILNITQEELADGVDLTRQAVHNIETEKTEPYLSTAFRIAKFFKKPIGDIFSLE